VPPSPQPLQVPGVIVTPSVPHNVCTGPDLVTSDDGSGGVRIVLARPSAISGCPAPPDATITLLDASGARLAVSGNAVDVGAAPYVELRWTNWCGAHAGSVQMREANATSTNNLHVIPACTVRSKPSLLVLGPMVSAVAIP